MTAFTGQGWSRATISDLETGRKTFTVEILRDVARVQQFPYSWYLEGPIYTDSANRTIPRQRDSGQRRDVIPFPVRHLRPVPALDRIAS